MPQLKVIVNKLNKRSGPVTDFRKKGNIVGTLNEGAVFKSVAEITNNLGAWHVDENGFVVWAGGLGKIPSSTEALVETRIDVQKYIGDRFDGNTLNEPIDYNFLLNINGSIKQTKGTGITIAIIDHPISSAMRSTVPIQRPLNSKEPLTNFHADFIFGIIAGIDNIIGISNHAQVISLPIYDEHGFLLDGGIENALAFVRDNPAPMIVNISNGFDANFDSFFNSFSRNKIVVSCAGVNEELEANQIRYPARRVDAIAVGAVDSGFTSINFSDKIDFLLPNFNYTSFKTPIDFVSDSGDSYSTAVISSIMALLLSSGVTDFDLDNIKQSLSTVSLTLADVSALSSLNPIKTST
jgi:subtilase family protein